MPLSPVTQEITRVFRSSAPGPGQEDQIHVSPYVTISQSSPLRPFAQNPSNFLFYHPPEKNPLLGQSARVIGIGPPGKSPYFKVQQ